jgi:phosphatidylglycerophosphatase A
MNKTLGYVATLGPVGFFPFAPGTVGSAVAAVGVWGLDLTGTGVPLYLSLTTLVCILGTWASDKAEAVFGKKDPGCVIIDEVAGYMISMALVPVTVGYLAAAFFLFRFFDVVKPPPINALQKLKGGAGVMADDILAGVFTNLVLQIWMRIH